MAVPKYVIESVQRLIFSNTEPWPPAHTMWGKKGDGDYFNFYVYYEGKWQDVSGEMTIPEISVYLSAFINDVGFITDAALTDYVTTTDLATKEDKMGIEAYTSETVTSLTCAASKYYRIDTVVNTLTITLPAITGNETVNIIIGLTTGANPAISFVSADSAPISKFEGYEVSALTSYEFNCLWNGVEWVIANNSIIRV